MISRPNALAWALAAGLCLGSAQASDDAAAVQQAIKDNYAAYGGFDEAKYRASLTEDYVLQREQHAPD